MDPVEDKVYSLLADAVGATLAVCFLLIWVIVFLLLAS